MSVSSFWACELINNTDYFCGNNDNSTDTSVRQKLPQLADDLMKDGCYDEVIKILNFLGNEKYFRDYFCYVLDVIAKYTNVEYSVYVQLKQNTAHVLNEKDYLEFVEEQPEDSVHYKCMNLSELGASGKDINRKFKA